MKFVLGALDEFIPSIPPPGGSPARQSATTQVTVEVVEWAGNIFRMWMPESVGELWSNWSPDSAHEDFEPTRQNGLLWKFEGNRDASIEVELTPLEYSLLLESRVTNRSKSDLSQVRVSHCLQLSQAPDFACGDFSRIHIRSNGKWEPLSALEPTSDYPFYYRAGFFSGGGIGWDGGKLAHCNQAAEADHPLIVCVSREGNRCVATASEDYWFLFHNRRNEHLRCIHSQQSPVPTLRPGETATFRQKIYFVDGGLARSVAAFEADTRRDQFQHYRFAADQQQSTRL
jgi:hypothetical protein